MAIDPQEPTVLRRDHTPEPSPAAATTVASPGPGRASAGFVARAWAHAQQSHLETPYLVLDPEQAAARLNEARTHSPEIDVYYAVKANPHPSLIRRLAAEGAGFDVASRQEIEICLAEGVRPERISYGSTIKKAGDIAFAHHWGIDLFVADAQDEVRKIAAHAPGARVFIRLLVETQGAAWSLGRKFGCDPAMAEDLVVLARALGLRPIGLSFHVGSQMRSVDQWERGIALAAHVMANLRGRGIELTLLNVGGGFPARLDNRLPPYAAYAGAIREAIARHFGDRRHRLTLMSEMGRALVADSGILISEVVLVSRKTANATQRWVYVDAGIFNGLFEALERDYRLPLDTGRGPDAPVGPAVLAGPTCDSFDTLYQGEAVDLPLDLSAGERVLFLTAGAYSLPMSMNNFNGFPPITALCV
jgi:ornithine decarboxylase